MLTDAQIIHLYEQWSGTPGSTYADLMQAAYAKALKDAAEVCGKLEEEELCLDVSSDEGKHGYAHERLAQAAAILALGKE